MTNSLYLGRRVGEHTLYGCIIQNAFITLGEREWNVVEKQLVRSPGGVAQAWNTNSCFLAFDSVFFPSSQGVRHVGHSTSELL